MNYPTPEENPLCKCKGNPVRAFFCQTGRMTECHFPYACSTAACSHLHKYDFTPEQVEKLEKMARRASELEILLYTFDDNGNARVVENVEPTLRMYLARLKSMASNDNQERTE